MVEVRRTTVTIPEDLYQEIEVLAKKEHRKPTAMLARLIEEAVEGRRLAAARKAAFEAGVDAAFGGLTGEEIGDLSGRLALRMRDEHID